MQRRNKDKLVRMVDFMFSHMEAIKRAVKEKREDNIRAGAKMTISAGHISDPTARKALQNMTELAAVTLENGSTVQYPERWIQVYDSVYKWCDERKKLIMRERYSGKDYVQTCSQHFISPTAYHSAIKDIRYRAVAGAAQLQLLTVV